MDDYSVTSRCYLSRALERLSSSRREDLYYAALEIRCGVEARLQEYLHPHEFIPIGKRKDWHAGKLHTTAEQAFRTGDKVQRVRIYEGNTHLATLYYVPVTLRLRKIAEKLGDYLHAAKKHYPSANEYWETFRALLQEGANLLAEATDGTLLGPVLIEKRTGLASMPTEVLSQPEGSTNPLLQLKGKSVQVEIMYYDSLSVAQSGMP